MRATPIAEFLSRKMGEAPSPRAAAPAPAPVARRVNVANDDSEPEFRRSGLVAALARRSPENPPLVRPLDASFAPRRDPPFRQPEPPAAPAYDWEAKLSEAYHRGVQEGLDAGKAEAATARALERAEVQKRSVVERLDFQMNEYARLSEAMATGFAELELRVSQAVARLLSPLLVDSVTQQIIDELVENVARLTRSGNLGLLKIRGPEQLLSAVKAKIETLAVDVEYVEEEGVEITVAANSTEICSELRSWTKLLEDIVGNG